MGIFFKGKPRPQQTGQQSGKWHKGKSRNAGSEQPLRSERITIEHKTFYLLLKENMRGRFLRITEESNGKSDTIIIPAAGLEEFGKLINEIVKTSEETPLSSEEPNDTGSSSSELY